MSYNELIRFCNLTNTKYKINAKTAPLTTIKVGGVADIVVYPKTINDFCSIIDILHESKIKYCILGNGSNCYFSDKYLGAVIITKQLDSISIENNSIISSCGALLANCAKMALYHTLTGLEFAFGIPGTVGGAVYMNAEAFGNRISDIVYKTIVYNINMKRIEELNNKENLFSNKSSIFTNNKHLIILKTHFKLNFSEYENIYSKMYSFLETRKRNQPLNLPSAGSVFKRSNGVIPAKLIDELSLKGFSVGGAEVSQKHAGFIVNKSCAKATDINELIMIIQRKTKEKYGVILDEEIIYIE